MPTHSSTTTITNTITKLHTLSHPSHARTWHTAPHPHLPLCATSSSDKTVRIYSLTNFRLHSLVSGGHKRSIRASAWKPNTTGTGESVLATGSFDAAAGIWRREHRAGDEARQHQSDHDDEDEDEWRFSSVLDGHDSEIKSVAWSASGQYLATCSRDKSVWIWEEVAGEAAGEDNFETVAVLAEHEGDVKCVAWHPSEALLVSGSYDDSLRLYREDVDDWVCVSVLRGHGGTVWGVDFEGEEVVGPPDGEGDDVVGEEERERWRSRREASGPRLLSCSDDLTIRLWRRVPKEREVEEESPTGQGRMPTIFRNNSIEEEWVEEACLPARHERSIYAVSWSKKTGLVVSTGGDGKVVVYRERWRRSAAKGDGLEARATEWVVVAELENAHGVYEINHACWSQRWDLATTSTDEEMLLTTGDDGEVKVWTLNRWTLNRLE